MKRKIETTLVAREEVIKAPLKRRFWYRLTFGKWGELHHRKHVMKIKFWTTVDNRVPYAHSIFDGVIGKRPPSFIVPAMVNCRCVMSKIIKDKL